jgi:KipI family sensor histidine kinase inhibitor
VPEDFTIASVGDAALVVRFANRIDPVVNTRVLQLANALETASLTGVRDVVPAFRSVTIHYDPLRSDVRSLRERIAAEACRESSGEPQGTAPERLIPVCYGGQFGPDLRAVADWAGLSEAEVIDAHTRVTYRVYMLGFLPGFAYLGTVDSRIAMPRRPTPRVHVPAGSVGIAGPQTGIYPVESPGGWNLIGRTPVSLYDIHQSPPSLFAPGDEVRFSAVDPRGYEHLRHESDRARSE